MLKETTNGVEYLVTTINGRKCKYLPTSNYIESDTTTYYNIHRTPKKQLWVLNICFNLDYYAVGCDKKDYFKNANRVMKSINESGKIINDLWLRRIAKSQYDLEKFDKLIGLFNDGRNSSDTENLSEEFLLHIIKKAISRAVKPYQKNARQVKQLIKLYK